MVRSIKWLIWAYLILLIVEGALRKWILPGLAEPLLIVRDPVVLLIYALALAAGVFPTNGWFMVLVGLTVASVITSVLGGMTHPVVMAYGIRINYLHVPLIWVMGSVMNRRDVERIGWFFLLAAIPMTALMVQQFRSPMDAWINKGVGSDEGGQLFGAEGRIRPPGLFAFITGPQLFYPFCAAFFLDQLAGNSRMRLPLLAACGVAILVALPVSISRTVMLATGVVGVAFALSLPFQPGNMARFVKPMFLLGVLGLIVAQLEVFKEGSTVFSSRWTQAASGLDGDGWQDVMLRMLNTVMNPIYYMMDAPLFGRGIGVGSNVGARLLSGQMGFLLAEEEYGKILQELGLFVGTAYILFRIALTGYLGLKAFEALRERKDGLAFLLYSATAYTLVYGQWAPPTVLGFSVFGAGLIMAALNPAGPRPLSSSVLPPSQGGASPIPWPMPGGKTLPAGKAGLPSPSERRPPFVRR